MESYWVYKPSLEKKEQFIEILALLEEDLENVKSVLSIESINTQISCIKHQLEYYKRRFYSFEVGKEDVVYSMTTEDYTDEELMSPEKIMEEKENSMSCYLIGSIGLVNAECKTKIL